MKKQDISSAGLHILAMICMLLDHLWATVVPGNDWMNCVGRLAFPIFAFLIVEGYFHTRNLKNYAKRLLIGAVISEIPFNLMLTGRLFYPFHQNVLWTFLLSLGLIHWNEKKGGGYLRGLLILLAGMIVGTLTMVDYYGYGVAMVLIFYFFRGEDWRSRLFQLLALYWINGVMMEGLVYEFEALGRLWTVPRQAFAVLALIPIWLYRGRLGEKRPGFRYFCYLFYPAHMLILGLMGYFG